MINYPTKKSSSTYTKNTNTANRGMALEEMINRSNQYYEVHDIAYVNKRPTPIKVIKTDGDYHITDAVFLSPSTLDYVGIFKGKYLDFEAKENQSIKGFPMSNIQEHQVKAMKNITNSGGISFAIIYFRKLNKIFLVDAKYIIEFKDNKKSIMTLEDIFKFGIELKESYNLPIDYISAVRQLYMN